MKAIQWIGKLTLFTFLLVSINGYGGTISDNFDDDSLEKDVWKLEGARVQGGIFELPEYNPEFLEIQETNGKLQFSGETPAGFKWSGAKAVVNFPIKENCDVQVELVTFQVEEGQTANAAIVLKGDLTQNWVSMQVDTEPGYDGIAVGGSDGGKGIWTDLQKEKPKLPVTLRMVYDGKKAEFYINGEKKGDKAIKVSDFFVGLAGCSRDPGDKMSAAFDNFILKSPDVPNIDVSVVQPSDKLTATWGLIKARD